MVTRTTKTTEKQATNHLQLSQEAKKVLTLQKKAVRKEAVSLEIKSLLAVQAVSLEDK